MGCKQSTPKTTATVQPPPPPMLYRPSRQPSPSLPSTHSSPSIPRVAQQRSTSQERQNLRRVRQSPSSNGNRGDSRQQSPDAAVPPAYATIVKSPPLPRPYTKGNPLGRVIGYSEDNTPIALYEKLQLLGEGSFGAAWLIQRNTDRKLFVAKIVDTSSLSPPEKEYAMSEIECFKESQGAPGIVQYEEHFFAGPCIVLVMEHADNGDLEADITRRQQAPLMGGNNITALGQYPEDYISFVFVMLLMALHHLHSKRMMHRDLKAANVFLFSDGFVKIGDFGLSRLFSESVSLRIGTTVCGTPYYFAPELFLNEPYSKKADLWALGVIVFEMISLKRPFASRHFQELKSAVLTQDVPQLDSFRYSRELCVACHLLLEKDPQRRPSVPELLKSTSMRSVVMNGVNYLRGLPSIPREVKQSIAEAVSKLMR